MKALAITVGILLGVGCLCGVAAFLFSIALTGKYCDISIEAIEFTSDNDAVRIAYRTRLTVETTLKIECPSRSMKNMTPWRIPTRPFVHHEEVSFHLAFSDEKDLDPETRTKRILIEAPKTYRLRPGERLVFYRKPGPKAYEGFFEVGPEGIVP